MIKKRIKKPVFGLFISSLKWHTALTCLCNVSKMIYGGQPGISIQARRYKSKIKFNLKKTPVELCLNSFLGKFFRYFNQNGIKFGISVNN